MVVALLLLIVLILLFGAAAVKSLMARIALGILIAVGAAVAFSLIASYIGQDATMAWLVGLGLVAGLFGFMMQSQSDVGRHDREAARQAGRERRKQSLKGVPKIERLWYHFRPDIVRLSPEAQTRARSLYMANDVQGLREFCRAEIDRESSRARQ